MALIREFLDEGPDPDVKDLIDRGVLIKISSKQVPKSNKRGREVRTRPGRNKDSIFSASIVTTFITHGIQF